MLDRVKESAVTVIADSDRYWGYHVTSESAVKLLSMFPGMKEFRLQTGDSWHSLLWIKVKYYNVKPF